jgi:hypothetical protein
MMLYQGCHILQFEPAADRAIQKAFRTCQDKAEKKIELEGEQVAVFTEQLENDVWSYFVSRPRPGILICATDQSYLAEVLKRVARKPERRALPADLPEWKHVDVKARVWSVRHYRKEYAEKDYTSPLSPRVPAQVSDPAAVGFVFWYSADSDKVVRARYLSGARDALKFATRWWHHPTEGLTPELRQVAAGVVEIVTPVTEEETAGFVLLLLMQTLGHGVNL